MKYLKNMLFLLNLVSIPHIFFAITRNANVVCIYRETVRKDVTQPVHTQAIPYQNATDIDCCAKNNYACQKRLQKSAQEYCNRPNRIPNGYTLSSVKVICGNGFAGEENGTEHTIE